MPELNVTADQVQIIAAQLSPEARAALVYFHDPDELLGVLSYPPEHATEIEAADPGDQLAPLNELKATRKREIDAEAERQRLRWITPGAGQAMTYARKVEQAKVVLAAQDPQPADYPMLAASIGIDGANLVAVANLVITMDQGWEQLGAAIEATRLSAKRAVEMAETVEDVAGVEITWPNPT